MLMLSITRSDMPLFLIINILGEDVSPTFKEPKFTELGLAEILGVPSIPQAREM
jgi:hypothetical protein